MKPHWVVIKVPTFPKEYKVYPENLPHWDRNDPNRYFEIYGDAQKDADRRNGLGK